MEVVIVPAGTVQTKPRAMNYALPFCRGEIVGVSFAIEPGTAAYVPLAHPYPGAPDQLNPAAVPQLLQPLLADERRGHSSGAWSTAFGRP